MKLFPIILLLALASTVQTFFAQTAPDTEIFLFKINKKNGALVFSEGKNISGNPGYDNQPAFSSDGKKIFFTSIRGAAKDTNIYSYDLRSGGISPVTNSADNEYTAKPFDENVLTFVREGRNQLMTVFKVDLRTGKETPAFSIKEPVAYYAFNRRGDALVWIRYAFMMHWVNAEKNINRYVADYAQPSVPHLVPGTEKFSFMQRHPDDSLWIKEFDPATEAVRPIVESREGKKDYAWMPDGSILMGGADGRIFRFDPKNQVDPKNQAGWLPAADLKSFGTGEITRLAVSPDGKYLALVGSR